MTISYIYFSNYALLTLNPPGTCVWKTPKGSCFSATAFKNAKFSSPYPFNGSWLFAA